MKLFFIKDHWLQTAADPWQTDLDLFIFKRKMENMYICNMQSYFLYVMQLQKLNSLEFRKVGCLPRVLDLLFQARFWFMVYYGSLNQVILFLHIVQFPFMHLLFAFQILKSPFIFTKKSTIFSSIQISSFD